MLITLFALAGFIAWRMLSMSMEGKGAASTKPTPLQPGSVVTVQQQSYACSSQELLGRSVAFKLAGANDKLRALVSQQECVLISPQQHLKIVSLKDKMALVEAGVPMPPRWMAGQDLVPLASPAL
jgi:hypothetical protein